MYIIQQNTDDYLACYVRLNTGIMVHELVMKFVLVRIMWKVYNVNSDTNPLSTDCRFHVCDNITHCI